MLGCVGERASREENEEAQLSAAVRSREPVLCAHPLPLPVTKPLLSPWCHRRLGDSRPAMPVPGLGHSRAARGGGTGALRALQGRAASRSCWVSASPCV